MLSYSLDSKKKLIELTISFIFIVIYKILNAKKKQES